jgi:hypothetical protein
MDEFMLVYNDLVPHVYAPESPVIEVSTTHILMRLMIYILCHKIVWNNIHSGNVANVSFS